MASMNSLIDLLKDGNARSIELMAAELDTSIEDIERMLEYLENTGVLKRTVLGAVGCPSCGGSCSGCGSKGGPCKGCMPENGFKNMGVIWEVCESR
jgi:hypothetical protein